MIRLARLASSRDDFDHPEQAYNCVEGIIAAWKSLLDGVHEWGFEPSRASVSAIFDCAATGYLNRCEKKEQ
jgi:hypothetical protein